MLLKVERLEKFSNFRDFVVLEIASMCASKKDFNENCMIYSYSNWPYQKKKNNNNISTTNDYFIFKSKFWWLWVQKGQYY